MIKAKKRVVISCIVAACLAMSTGVLMASAYGSDSFDNDEWVDVSEGSTPISDNSDDEDNPFVDVSTESSEESWVDTSKTEVSQQSDDETSNPFGEGSTIEETSIIWEDVSVPDDSTDVTGETSETSTSGGSGTQVSDTSRNPEVSTVYHEDSSKEEGSQTSEYHNVSTPSDRETSNDSEGKASYIGLDTSNTDGGDGSTGNTDTTGTDTSDTYGETTGADKEESYGRVALGYSDSQKDASLIIIEPDPDGTVKTSDSTGAIVTVGAVLALASAGVALSISKKKKGERE